MFVALKKNSSTSMTPIFVFMCDKVAVCVNEYGS